MSNIFLPYMLVGAFSSPFWKQNKDELEGIDIEKEYTLIQQKKSGLSCRLRDMVEWKYKKLQENK